jgi:ketosteroid isomerase-like protein
MKSVLAFATALLVGSAALAQQPPLPPEFKRAIDTADAAWNKRDLTLAMQLYAPDATLSLGAMQLKGVRDIQAYMQTTLDSLPRNIMRRTIVRRIEKVENLLLVDTEILIERPGADGKPELLRSLSGVNLIRQDAKGIRILAVRLVPLNKE